MKTGRQPLEGRRPINMLEQSSRALRSAKTRQRSVNYKPYCGDLSRANPVRRSEGDRRAARGS